ncbi:MAG: hypothetical protein ACRD3S_16785, partial [Terracidiphilus sp.]
MALMRILEKLFPARILSVAVIALTAAGSSGAAQAPHVVLSGATTSVFVAPQEPGPVLRAAKDLQRDFAKVFGTAPKIGNDLTASGPVTLVIAEAENVPAELGCAESTDRESFTFSVVNSGDGSAKRQVVCLVGADMRGTIYAIYEFSQKVLGVDPMYLWTDKEPAKRVSIALPADFAHTYPSPIFKYR